MQINYQSDYLYESNNNSVSWTSSLLNQAAFIGQQIIGETVTNIATDLFKVGLEHPSFGKVIGGTLSIANGAYCIMKSGVPKKVWKYFNNQNYKDSSLKKTQVNLASETLTRGTVFTLGIVSLAYGVQCLYSGICEMMDPENQELDCELYFPSETSDEDQSITSSKKDPYEIIYEIFEQLQTCPASSKILSKVEKEGLYEIVPLPADQIPYPTYKASWNSFKRVLYFKQGLEQQPDQLLSTFLFEFLNALQSKQAKIIHEEGVKGQLSVQDYIMKMERIEHNNRMLYLEIYQTCRQSNQWPKDPTNFYKMAGDFEDIWNRFIKHSTHATWFKKTWEKNYRKPYCQAHPSSIECGKTEL